MTAACWEDVDQRVKKKCSVFSDAIFFFHRSGSVFRPLHIPPAETLTHGIPAVIAVIVAPSWRLTQSSGTYAARLSSCSSISTPPSLPFALWLLHQYADHVCSADHNSLYGYKWRQQVFLHLSICIYNYFGVVLCSKQRKHTMKRISKVFL